MRLARHALQISATLILVACGHGSDAPQPVMHAAERASAAWNEPTTIGPVAVVFRNVNLHVTDAVVLEVRRIDGALLGAVPGRPPAFDDPRSYRLRIDYGEVAMSGASLTRLLNDHVFAYEGSPLTNLEVSMEGGSLRQKGTLRKGIRVPFSILAEVSSSSDGRLRLHPKSIKAAGIGAGGLMKVFGLELDEIIKVDRAPGVQLDGSDFLLDPGRLLPATRIIGRVTAAWIEGNRIVQVFGSPTRGAELVPPDRHARNFMYYRGGTLRFGKLTMSDADMQLIDADSSDVFDFFPERYVRQLVAGYSKNTPSGGLKVYMPDYNQTRGADLRPTGSQ